MKKVLVVLSIFFCASGLVAQHLATVAVDEMVSYLFDIGQTEEEADENLTEHFLNLLHHPVDLNRDAASRFYDLMVLDPLQIEAIIQYREQMGPFAHPLELHQLAVLPLEMLRLILPFISVEKQSDSAPGVRQELALRWSQSIEVPQAYLSKQGGPVYQGNRAHMLLRHRFSHGEKIAGGLNLEKDAGEALWNPQIKSKIDYVSAHLRWSPNPNLKILFGDYQLQFAQGLLLWTGRGFGKSAMVMQVKKQGHGFRPHSAFEEVRFFRGLAMSWQKGPWVFSSFYSKRKVDAQWEGGKVSALPQTGYHRTLHELEGRNGLSLLHSGGNVSMKRSWGHIGFTGLYSYTERRFTDHRPLYQLANNVPLHRFQGSLDFSWQHKNRQLFGEADWQKGGPSFVLGLLLALDPKLSFSVVVRRFHFRHFSPLARAFSNSTSTQNERGVFAGMHWFLKQKWQLSSYIDIYSRPWLSFGINAPSYGSDLLLTLQYSISKKHSLGFRYRQQNGQIPFAKESLIFSRLFDKKQIQVDLKMALNNHLTWHGRIALSLYTTKEVSPGSLLFHEFVWKKLEQPWSFSMRYVLFDVTDFNNRIYTYERDLMYAYSMPALMGQGQRLYFLWHYVSRFGFDMGMKWGTTIYSDRKEISSGNERIWGNRKSEIKCQLRFRF